MTQPTKDEVDLLASNIIRPESLAQQVYRTIRDAILTGQLKPGEKVVETKLAAQLGTSRSPVREAIRKLTSEQLLSQQDGVIRVCNPSYEDYRQLYELRITIESTAARLAAARITDDALARLEDNLARTSRCLVDRNTSGLLQCNADFHACIVESAGNQQFARVFHEVSTLIHFYTYLVLHINQLQTNVLQEHRLILEALHRRDAQGAHQAMQLHIQRDPAVVEAAFRKQRLS